MPYIFRIDYRFTYHERVSTFGGMDSEPTGKVLEGTGKYLMLAPSEDFARLYFKNHMPSTYTVTTFENLGLLDAEVRTCYGTALG